MAESKYVVYLSIYEESRNDSSRYLKNMQIGKFSLPREAMMQALKIAQQEGVPLHRKSYFPHGWGYTVGNQAINDHWIDSIWDKGGNHNRDFGILENKAVE